MKKEKIGNLGKDLARLLTVRSKEKAIDGTIRLLMDEKGRCDYEERKIFNKHTKKEDWNKYSYFSWDDETGDVFGCEKEIKDDFTETFAKELVESVLKPYEDQIKKRSRERT